MVHDQEIPNWSDIHMTSFWKEKSIGSDQKRGLKREFMIWGTKMQAKV
jgi:hypothetical protein